MADSIQEQLMNQMVAQLSLITTANGYSNTIASVQRWNQGGVETIAVPTLVLKEGECTAELSQSVFPSIKRRLTVEVIIIALQDEADSRSGGEIINGLVADVELAIAANRTWNGLAIMSDPPTYFEAELDAVMPHLAKGMRFEVVYEHLRHNPYEQAS